MTIAVVSWNTRDLLLRCLDALRADASCGRAEVIVVDNASTDDSAGAVRSHAPWARVIALERNAGFGAAVNLAAAGSRAPWLVAANADVAPAPRALATLLAAGSDPRVGAVAPRLRLPGGSVQHSVGPLPTPVLTLAFALGVHRVVPGLGDRLCLEGHWNPDRARDVPWAIGALLLLRRAAFDAVGGFDERQWMYAEDLDLCWRLGDAGWRIRYEPRASAEHASGAATEIAFGDGRRRRFMRATYEVIAWRRGAGAARAVALAGAAGAAARLVWMAPLALVARRRRGPARDTLMWLLAHLQGVRRR